MLFLTRAIEKIELSYIEMGGNCGRNGCLGN